MKQPSPTQEAFDYEAWKQLLAKKYPVYYSIFNTQLIMKTMFMKGISSIFSKMSIFCLLIALSTTIYAQRLDGTNRVSLTLNDGTRVNLIGEAETFSDERSNRFYYLPTNLRLSERQDGIKEFLFMKYTSNSDEDVQGAKLHFLMEFGLTSNQQAEAEQKLIDKIADSLTEEPVIVGPATMLPSGPESFQIISATMKDGTVEASTVTSGRAPTLPGSKMAVASSLDKNEAQILLATFEEGSSVADLSLNLMFEYQARMPSVDGRITMDWARFDSLYQSYSRQYSHTDEDDGTLPMFINSLKDDIISDSERDNLFQSMVEERIVKIELEGDEDDPTALEVISSFMEMFITMISDTEMETPEVPEGLESMDRYEPDINLYKYRLNRSKLVQKASRKTETYSLSARMFKKDVHILTENVGGWTDKMQGNPENFKSIILEDPFYDIRDVIFVLDLDSKDLFETEANYVTVNLRKQREGGTYFEDRLTIDKAFLEKNGVQGVIKYARGEDFNQDIYEYQVQWSLRGGEVYPQRPKWEKGSWEGVTLSPPLKPRTIELESDLQELKSLGITRVTAQLMYLKYGELVETNVHVSPGRKKSLIEQQIFADKFAPGYVYRLIFNHKSRGKLVMDWNEKLNDDYIYTVIPDELLADDPSALDQIIERSREELTKTAEELQDDVKDRFKKVFKNNDHASTN